MKKLLALTSATILSASTLAAGELAYVAPEVTMIEEPAGMGGSGAWLIPLIIIAILILSTSECNPRQRLCPIRG